jgi:hypothetical protein
MLPKYLIDRFGVDGERFSQKLVRFGIVPLSLLVKTSLRQRSGSIRFVLGIAILHNIAPFGFCD